MSELKQVKPIKLFSNNMSEQLKIQIRQARANYFTASATPYDLSVRAKYYQGLFDECMRATRGDVLAAWDTMFMEDNQMRTAFNRILAQADSNIRIGYSDISQVLKEDATNLRAAGLYDTTNALNAGNLVQTTVADYILSRVEELGQVIKLTSRFSIPDGNLSVPKFAANPIAQFGLDGAPLSNGNQDVNQVTITPHQYGIWLGLTLAFLAKVNPRNVNYITEKLAEAMARAADYAVVNGSGTNGNPLGILSNATSITPGGSDTIFDVIDTFIQQASLVKIPKNKLTILMNGALEGKAYKTRRTGSQYGSYVSMEPGENGGTIDGVRYVVTEQINNVGSAGSQTAQLIGGNFSHYAWGDNGDIRTVVDNYTGLTNLTQKIVSYGFADGQPLYSDSFFKANITTGL
jgi:HK97 family phage major capsid protein